MKCSKLVTKLASGLFRSVIFHILTEYGEMQSIPMYSVQMLENTDQNNSECGHVSCSAKYSFLRGTVVCMYRDR